MNYQILYAFALAGVVSTPLAMVSSLPASATTPMQPIWYNCLSREVFTPAKQTWCDRWRTLQNTSYLVPSSLDAGAGLSTVAFKNGRYQRPDGKLSVELVNQRGWIDFADINGDGKQDAAVIFAVTLNPKGTAIATYLTAVLDVDNQPQALLPVRLGERIMINGPVTIRKNSITVPFLTQKQGINRVYTVHPGLKAQE